MRTLVRILSGLQILLLLGAYALYHLCRSSMGVMRHIVYMNRKWQAAFNMDILFISLAALFIICAFRQILRRRKLHKPLKPYSSWPLLLLLSISTLCFMLICQNSGLRPYYQLLCIFNLILFLQLTKSFCLRGSD